MMRRLTDDDIFEMNRYLERYYGSVYCMIPKTPRFDRFKRKLFDHFQWTSDMVTHEDMTFGEYAIFVWELGPFVKDFVQAEIDLIRGIPAHVAWQSELCNCA
jgi:hypothetical protein